MKKIIFILMVLGFCTQNMFTQVANPSEQPISIYTGNTFEWFPMFVGYDNSLDLKYCNAFFTKIIKTNNDFFEVEITFVYSNICIPCVYQVQKGDTLMLSGGYQFFSEFLITDIEPNFITLQKIQDYS